MRNCQKLPVPNQGSSSQRAAQLPSTALHTQDCLHCVVAQILPLIESEAKLKLSAAL